MKYVLELILFSIPFHVIESILIYRDVRREDKGVYKDASKLFFLRYILKILCLPYDFTIGIIDGMREKRLCNLLVDRDDEISNLKYKLLELQTDQARRIRYEEYLRSRANSSIPPDTYCDFCKYEHLFHRS